MTLIHCLYYDIHFNIHDQENISEIQGSTWFWYFEKYHTNQSVRIATLVQKKTDTENANKEYTMFDHGVWPIVPTSLSAVPFDYH